MIILYLKRLAAHRAYTAAQNRDRRAWEAYQLGERPQVPDVARGEGTVVLCDATQHQVTCAWRHVQTTREAWEHALEAL